MNPAVERFAELVKSCCGGKLNMTDSDRQLELSVDIPHTEWIDQKTATELAMGLAFFGIEADQARMREEGPGDRIQLEEVLAQSSFHAENRRGFLWGLIQVKSQKQQTRIMKVRNPNGEPINLDDLQVPSMDNYDRITVRLGYKPESA